MRASFYLTKAAILICLLSACDSPAPGTPQTSAAQTQQFDPSKPQRSSDEAMQMFSAITARIEPVAQTECKRRAGDLNCDFKFTVDKRPNEQINAFYKLSEDARPEIIFNIALLRHARNADEIALVMGHETAHHIERHPARTYRNAVIGAALLGQLAQSTGIKDDRKIEQIMRQGANTGARIYSKEFELEADKLGTVIAAKAGYDPVIGVRFFTIIPDPGNKFLHTHPHHAQRISAVRRTSAKIRTSAN